MGCGNWTAANWPTAWICNGSTPEDPTSVIGRVRFLGTAVGITSTTSEKNVAEPATNGNTIEVPCTVPPTGEVSTVPTVFPLGSVRKVVEGTENLRLAVPV